jgi:hypothetical protein
MRSSEAAPQPCAPRSPSASGSAPGVVRVSEPLGRDLRLDRVDGHARRELEAGRMREARQDLDVPDEVGLVGVTARGAIDDEVIGRIIEDRAQAAEHVDEDRAERGKVARSERSNVGAACRGRIQISYGVREANGVNATNDSFEATTRTAASTSARQSSTYTLLPVTW